VENTILLKITLIIKIERKQSSGYLTKIILTL